MKSWTLVACLLASALSARAAVSTNSSASLGTAPGVAPTNAYPLQIVTCHDDVDVDALLAEQQVQLQSPKHKLANLKMFFVPPDAALIQRLKADPRVLAVEADGPVSFSGQWIVGQTIVGQYTADGLLRMGIPQFPSAHINGTSEPIDVDVAILDSGVGPHVELNVVDSFSAYGGNGYDFVGHGTSVAGVLGARDNASGVVGVAPGVRIWNVQVGGELPEHNTWANLLTGINYVLQYSNKISVANMNLNNAGTGAPFVSIRSSIRKLAQSGIVVVASAGNHGQDLAGPDGVYGTGDDALPASLHWAMAVSAMDATVYTEGSQPRDQIWPSSNFSQIERTNNPALGTNFVVSPGGAIDVAAPGVNILTTASSNRFGIQTGTSFASPHVAGLVALYIAANGRATNEAGVFQIRQAIVDSALPQAQWHTNNTLDPDTPEKLAS